MDIAIQFNNQGVRYLRHQHKFGDALNTFQCAVDSMLCTINTSGSPSNNIVNNIVLRSSCLLEKEFDLNKTPAKSAIRLPCLYNQNDKTTTQSFTYVKAIMLPQTNCFTDDTMDLLCAVILYNFALTNHLHGEPESLKKALQLYAVAGGLLTDLENVLSYSEEDANVSSLLVMAILNNMSEIHYNHYSNHERAKVLLDDLKLFISAMEPQQTYAEQMEIEKEFFLGNAIVFSRQPIGAAVA